MPVPRHTRNASPAVRRRNAARAYYRQRARTAVAQRRFVRALRETGSVAAALSAAAVTFNQAAVWLSDPSFRKRQRRARQDYRK